MRQYEMFELEFQGEEPEGSWTDVDLWARFGWENNEEEAFTYQVVKGFYAGNGIYKVRFLPEKIGQYTWKVWGCVEAEGSELCEPEAEAAVPRRNGFATGKHGIVRAKDTHFEYSDGTIYRPFGTTIYALANQPQERIDQTMKTLAKAPFNKVRHCVFPKFYDYNREDPEVYPFEKDENGEWSMDRPCFAYWEKLEKVIFQLADMGIESDLILFHSYDKWGFSQLNMKQTFLYLDYLLRRLSAIPEMWWSLANEFDLMYARTMEDWYAIEEYVAENDPYHHLLSNHNCFSFYDFTRPNITHCCVQTIQMESAAKWIEKYKKPLIYDECCYEGNLPLSWGNLSGFEMAHRFWQACVPGAYASHGEVFLADDDVLWWAKGGELKGSSPVRIRFLRDIMEELPGTLEPWHPQMWEMPDMGYMSKAPMDLFKNLHLSMPLEQQESMLVKDGLCCGHIEDKVFMEYFGHRCCGLVRWILPENHTYRIEKIDIWKMTRETVCKGVNGKVEVKLPGKEGIALMATIEE